MKTWLLLLCVVSFSLSGKAQVVAKHGKLSVEGTRLMDEKGKQLVLHGMSFGWHNLWPRFYNTGAVRELVREWGSTVIRASMGIELNNRGYLKDPENSEKLVRTVIDACIKEDVYVIVDWHDHNIHLPEARDFFDKLSKEYGQHPHLIYEIFNEPDHESWPEVKAYAEEIIKTIRVNDPDNLILVGSSHWDQDVHLAAADPIRGYDNLMYTMHFYAGTHKKWLRDRTDAAMEKGLPVFVSECAAMEATGDGPIDTAEWNSFVDWMDARKLSWVIWSVSDKNETCSVLRPSAAPDGNWTEEDIKESGKLARFFLKTRYPEDP